MASGKPHAPRAERAMAHSASRRERAGAASRRDGSNRLIGKLLPRFAGGNKCPRQATSRRHGLALRARGEGVAEAAQALEVRRLDGLAQELHVALDLRLVRARAVEVRLGVAVG